MDARERPARDDEEYRRLVEKHRGYESRLAELAAKRHLSPDEEVEQINLKKYKLRVKDRMEHLARATRQG